MFTFLFISAVLLWFCGLMILPVCLMAVLVVAFIHSINSKPPETEEEIAKNDEELREVIKLWSILGLLIAFIIFMLKL